MTDIKSPQLLYFKGGLFVLLGVMTFTLLVLQTPTLRTVFLMSVCVWSFARAYYFAFYVVQHYVDDEFRFAGLFDFLKYAIRNRSVDTPGDK